MGKITEESKTVWIEQATNNFEGTKTMLSSIGGVVEAEDITNKITPVIIEGRKDWSFDKWQNEDSKGLGEMKVNDVEKFNALLEKHLED